MNNILINWRKKINKTGMRSLDDEYESFRSSVAQRKIVVDDDGNREWIIYEAGPKSIYCPLICLPPVTGSADVFYKQILSLSSHGYRILALEFPPYWTISSFCDGFSKLLDQLRLKKVHLFGASLGGFLAQKFSEHTYGMPTVLSLILCNTFIDTTIFDREDTALFYWAMPALMMKRMILGGFPQVPTDQDIVSSIDFMVENLENLNQRQLASRLTLNCTKSRCNTRKVAHRPITIIDVYDDCALTSYAREDLRRAYPLAKIASLKTGGNFPYLSRSAEVNLIIRLHLKQFEGTDLTAKEEIESSEHDAVRNIDHLLTVDDAHSLETEYFNLNEKLFSPLQVETRPKSPKIES